MGGNSIGEGIKIDFNSDQTIVSQEQTGIRMEGSNTSMCDEEGNLLFYSNGCLIINAAGELMENGDTINPGFLQDYFCPYGGSPIRQGVVSIPSPENEDQYYVFNLDFDDAYPSDTTQLEAAPLRVYYQKIDMTQANGLGAVVAKNQIAVQDTFSRGNLQAVRHANNRDWWVVIPKSNSNSNSNSNCYFLIRITPEGVQSPLLKCAGAVWTGIDDGTHASISPNLKKYIRFNAWNGLNIFDFDNATGNLSNPIRIFFPNDTIRYFVGVAVSSNSRFLYVCIPKKVYQFDLEAVDIEASKIQVAEWDGTVNPFPTIFYLAALAPDGKIYISSTSSHLSLHVIEAPNNLGLDCRLIQNGVKLPSYNFATIPNNPHYCRSEEECEVTVNNVDIIEVSEPVVVYPNPSKNIFNFKLPQDAKSIEILDVTGRIVLKKNIHQTSFQWSADQVMNGIYWSHF